MIRRHANVAVLLVFACALLISCVSPREAERSYVVPITVVYDKETSANKTTITIEVTARADRQTDATQTISPTTDVDVGAIP